MRSPQSVALLVVAILSGLVASMGVRQVLDHPTSSRVERDTFDEFAPPAENAFDWPPQPGVAYPDLKLRDLDGNPVQLSHFRGKVLLIEPVGVACRGCQAFAGGHSAGGVFGLQPQAGLKSIHEYVETFGGVRLSDDRIQVIQILFYGPRSTRAPTLAEARKWAEHYHSVAPHTKVLLADQSMIGAATRAMIPGFHLVDRDFVLQCAAGNPPQRDLYRDLIPMIGQLLVR